MEPGHCGQHGEHAPSLVEEVIKAEQEPVLAKSMGEHHVQEFPQKIKTVTLKLVQVSIGKTYFSVIKEAFPKCTIQNP